MDSERTTRRTSQRLAKAPPPGKRCLEGEKEKLSALQGGVGAMAVERCRKKLREETICSVCQDYFTEPVFLDCGHNFCRACIVKSCAMSSADAACPQCWERVQMSSLRTNRHLANVVEIAKELSDLPRPEVGGRGVCEWHQEPLKVFCQEDGAPICVVCNRSKEHRAHRVVPIEEAGQACQDQIRRSVEILRKERENILQFQAESEKKTQNLLKQMAAERVKTAAAFQQLHQFLEEQEKLLLAQREEVEQEIIRRQDEHQATHSAELSSLDSLIRELEEKQQQSANELLQSIGDILGRCKKEFKNPVAFPADLKWRIHEFFDTNPFLESLMKQFQDSLLSGLQIQEANITLDPEMTHPRLVLSADGKSMRDGDERQDMLSDPVRFDLWPFVLGRERLATGRYFWDVAVGREEAWAVGVTSRPWSIYEHEKGLLGLGRWGGAYRVSVNPEDPSLALSQDLKRIRVTLNCAGGRMAFFDADTGEKLHDFSDASFSGETFLPFFYVLGGGQLMLCP